VLAEASVVVVVDVPGVDDDADPQVAVPVAGIGEAGVVAGQKLAEDGDHGVKHQFLVCRIDEGEQAIASIGEPVAAARADP
jgi:hypothetical protein